MHANIEHLWKELESRKSEFLAVLDSWSEDQRQFRPEGQWNAVQVLEHILESEQGVLGYMKKKTSSGWEAIAPTTAEHDANSAALNDRLVSRSAYKIPAVLTEPQGGADYLTLREQWNGLRHEYATFLAELEPEFHHRQIFNQPIAGRMNLMQTLQFLSNHILHHSYQLEKLASLRQANP